MQFNLGVSVMALQVLIVVVVGRLPGRELYGSAERTAAASDGFCL